jgi:phage-related baseplate assembly protein
LSTVLLSDLLKNRSEAEWFEFLRLRSVAIAAEQGGGLPDDWFSGGRYYTLMRAFSAGLAELEAVVPQIVKGGFSELAEGLWLDLHAQDVLLARNPSTFTRHRVVATAASGSGPYNIQANQLWGETPGGLRFNSITTGLLPAGGTLALEFLAEHPGAAYNVGLNQITRLATALPGVSISNPAIPASSPATSIISAGRDIETDAALRERIRLRYATLSQTERVALAYRKLALEAHPDILKVSIRDNLPAGPNTLDVVLWGDGALSGAALTAAQIVLNNLKGITANQGRAIGDWVYAATQVNVPVTATLRVLAGNRALAETLAASRLAALERNYPIGGLEGLLYRSQVFDALFVTDPNVPGLTQNLTLTAPATDVALTNIQVVRFNPINITVVEV